MNRKDLKEYFRVLYAPQQQEQPDPLLKEASEADADEAGMKRHLATNRSEVYLSRAQGAAIEVVDVMRKYGLGQPDLTILAKHLLAAYDENENSASETDDSYKHDLPPDPTGEAPEGFYDPEEAEINAREWERLNNPVSDTADYSEEYKKMIDSFSPYDK